MEIKNIEFYTEWTNDCSGKQDFDFPVLRVSTRYWPDHTAKPSILLGREYVLAELPDKQYIEGRTEAECKQKVEEWVKKEITKILDKII